MLAGACLAALAVILTSMPAAASTNAGNSAESSITVGLEVSRSGAERPLLAVRGYRNGPGATGTFEVDADVSRIPCPGAYRFEAAQENTRNGNSATYTALIKLLDPELRPPGARCGVAPPPLSGQIRIALGARESEPFVLRGERRGGGQFKGRLSFISFPECDRPYQLKTALDLAGWDRNVDFRVRILEVDATIQGKKVLDERC